MTALDDMTLVVELACLTEDRTDEEQRALLRVAARLDREANRFTTTNRRSGPASRLTRLVHDTRELVDDQRPVGLKAGELEKLEAHAALWDEFHEAFQRGEWTPAMIEAGV